MLQIVFRICVTLFFELNFITLLNANLILKRKVAVYTG